MVRKAITCGNQKFKNQTVRTMDIEIKIHREITVINTSKNCKRKKNEQNALNVQG